MFVKVGVDCFFKVFTFFFTDITGINLDAFLFGIFEIKKNFKFQIIVEITS